MTLKEFAEGGGLAEALDKIQVELDALAPSDEGECYLNDLWLPESVVRAMLQGGRAFAFGRLKELGWDGRKKGK